PRVVAAPGAVPERFARLAPVSDHLHRTAGCGGGHGGRAFGVGENDITHAAVQRNDHFLSWLDASAVDLCDRGRGDSGLTADRLERVIGLGGQHAPTGALFWRNALQGGLQSAAFAWRDAQQMIEAGRRYGALE